MDYAVCAISDLTKTLPQERLPAWYVGRSPLSCYRRLLLAQGVRKNDPKCTIIKRTFQPSTAPASCKVVIFSDSDSRATLESRSVRANLYPLFLEDFTVCIVVVIFQDVATAAHVAKKNQATTSHSKRAPSLIFEREPIFRFVT